jgi:hypothetical protein
MAAIPPKVPVEKSPAGYFSRYHFTELRRVAKCLKDSGRYAPEFFFARSYPTLARDTAVCIQLGFPCYDQNGRPCVAQLISPFE